MEGLGHNSKCHVTYFSYLNKKKMCYYFVYLKMAIQVFKLVCCVTINLDLFAQSIKRQMGE